jgi:hypothetical protein
MLILHGKQLIQLAWSNKASFFGNASDIMLYSLLQGQEQSGWRNRYRYRYIDVSDQFAGSAYIQRCHWGSTFF